MIAAVLTCLICNVSTCIVWQCIMVWYRHPSLSFRLLAVASGHCRPIGTAEGAVLSHPTVSSKFQL